VIIYLGVFQIALAYRFLVRAAAELPALDISLLLLLEPVFNPIWTWLFDGENPGLWTFFGGAVIVAATAAKAIRDSRPHEDDGSSRAHEATGGHNARDEIKQRLLD
jgi:drug/metabolite transporter (DMT)-like permease